MLPLFVNMEITPAIITLNPFLDASIEIAHEFAKRYGDFQSLFGCFLAPEIVSVKEKNFFQSLFGCFIVSCPLNPASTIVLSIPFWMLQRQTRDYEDRRKHSNSQSFFGCFINFLLNLLLGLKLSIPFWMLLEG